MWKLALLLLASVTNALPVGNMIQPVQFVTGVTISTSLPKANFILPIIGNNIAPSSSVAYVDQSNTFTSSQTIKDGTAGGLLVKGDSVTANAFFGDGSHLTGISAAPGGPNYQLQFSSNGTFGGVPYSTVLATTASLGLQVAVPVAPLHVAGVYGQTVNASSIAYATLVQDVQITSPTAYAITQINSPSVPTVNSSVITYIEPDNGSMFATQNTGESGYIATGQTITYNVYGFRYGQSGIAVIDPTPNTFSVTDFINDFATPFGVDLTGFSTASGQIDGYLISKQDDQGYGPYWIAVANPGLTTYNDTGYTNQDPYIASGYVANNSMWSVQLAQYKLIAGGDYRTDPYVTNLTADDGSSRYMIVTSNWNPPTDDGYVVQSSQGGNFTNIVTATSFIDYNQTGTGDLPAFTSYAFPYFNTTLAPAADATIQIDYGSGNLFANNSTYHVEIWEYRTNAADGIKYFAASASVSSDVTDDNSFNLLTLSGTFTPGDGDGRVVLLYTNGSLTAGIDVGNNSSYNGLDTQPTPAVTPAISGYTGATRSYSAYGFVTSPTTKYSANAKTIGFTDNNPVDGYVISHLSSSYGNATGVKIINTTTSQHVTPNSLSGVATIEFAGSHDGDITVTPNTVGYLSNGANLNIDYRIYATRTISGIGVYSSSAAHVVTVDPNNGLYYNVNVSYAPVASATYKAVRSVNGGASQFFTNGPTFFTDNTQLGWSAGTGALTPNFGPITAAQFDRANLSGSSSDPGVVTFNSTNGNLPLYNRFTLQGTNKAYYGINNTANFFVDSQNSGLMVGNLSAPHTQFSDGVHGDITTFNKQSSASNPTLFKGSFFSTLMYSDPSTDTTFFGNTNGGAIGNPQTTVAIMQNSSKSGMMFRPDAGVPLSQTMVSLENNSFQVPWGITNNGKEWVGTPGGNPNTGNLNVGQGDATYGQIVLADNGTFNNSVIGNLWRYSPSGNGQSLDFTDAGGNHRIFMDQGSGTPYAYFHGDGNGFLTQDNKLTTNAGGTLVIATVQIEAKNGVSLDSGKTLSMGSGDNINFTNANITGPGGAMIEIDKNLILDTTATIKGNAFSVGGSSFSVIASTTNLGGLLQGTTAYFSRTVTASTFNAVGSAYQMNGVTVIDSTNNIFASSASYAANVTIASTETVKGNAFSVGGSTLVVSGGSIGIGTTTINATLDIFNNKPATQYVLAISSQDNTHGIFNIQGNGRVGIGLEQSPAMFAIQNSTASPMAVQVSSNNGTVMFGINNAGNIFVATNTAFSGAALTVNGPNPISAVMTGTLVLGATFQITSNALFQVGGGSFTVLQNGHVETKGSLPTLSACGTGPTNVGNDTTGKITVGTSAGTTCTLTFKNSWTNSPACVATDETNNIPLRAVTTTTTIVITGTALSSDVISYFCTGYR